MPEPLLVAKENWSKSLPDFLDEAVARFNTPEFIAQDPISVPHRFSRLQDRAIIGFWAATLAWGERKTIIQNANQLAAFSFFRSGVARSSQSAAPGIPHTAKLQDHRERQPIG